MSFAHEFNRNVEILHHGSYCLCPIFLAELLYLIDGHMVDDRSVLW